MDYPPTKRLKGLNHEVVAAFSDPFGDDEDFTQDDLDEIDIIASQAVTTDAGGPGSKLAVGGSAWVGSTQQNKLFPLGRTNQSRGNTEGNGGSSRGSNGQQSRSGRESSSSLEDQHADLKRKLKEVEELIVLKSGEIQVLRDSLRTAQQEKEAQRQAQLLLQRDRQREQSDKEKELAKKVQSLQSELHFKEAEINEMKMKLHNSDRSSKTTSPLARHSPSVLSSVTQLHHGSGSSSSSPTGNGFITKETFGAQLPSRTTPARRDADRLGSSSRSSDRQEVPHPDPFLSTRPQQHQHRGVVLLGLLLQQPLSPSSIGLCHLLSAGPAGHLLSAGPAGHLRSAGPAGHLRGLAGSSSSSTGLLVHHDPRAGLSRVQSLAVTGVNMLSQCRNSSCRGAVLLLPLLDLHLTRLCQALDSLSTATGTSPGSGTAGSGPAGRPGAGLGGSQEETGFSLESTGLAALRLLYLLLAHSDEVVQAMLTDDQATDNKSETDQSGRRSLQCLLRLCDVEFCSGSQKDVLVRTAMKTVLQCVLQSQFLSVSLSVDSSCQTVSQCVSVLRSVANHQHLAEELCCQHDVCLLLRLFHYVRTRPDNQATDTHWTLLDLQVVRVLSRLVRKWPSNSCQCYTELVQTVVVVFHRQWLDLRGPQGPPDTRGLRHSGLRPCCPGVTLLRESLLLLHWLLLHHSSFSESCRPVLHMYDQVIPSVRDTLRRIAVLSDSEELALDEICRSEGDDTDDMDTDAGS
ncbi:ATR-interacting protein [Diretmus argenteus]